MQEKKYARIIIIHKRDKCINNFLDQLKYASNTIQCVTDDQYEKVLGVLVPKVCGKYGTMKVGTYSYVAT